MSNQLPYRLEIENRRAIVALLPELNEVPWADIEKVGSEILAQIAPLASPSLLVDLCALNYMGSAQVALVVRMFKTVVKEKNGKMVVANRDPMVLEVLSLAGLNKVWTIVDSRERAMSMLGGGSIMSSSLGGGGSSGYSGDVQPLPGMVALVAALAAAVFLVIHLANPSLIPSRGDLFGALAASAVAFLAGLWAMNSGNRNLGVGVLVVSVLMLLYGVFEIAKPGTGGPAPAKPDSTEPAGDTTKPSATPGTTPGTTPGVAPAATVPGVTPDPGAPAPTSATPPSGGGAAATPPGTSTPAVPITTPSTAPQ